MACRQVHKSQLLWYYQSMQNPDICIRHTASPQVPLGTSEQIKKYSRKIANEHLRVLGALLNAGYDIVNQTGTVVHLVHLRKATAIFLDMTFEELPEKVRERVERSVNSIFFA